MIQSVVNPKEIDSLVAEEKKLRSRLAALEKQKGKGNADECRYLTIDIKRCVRKQLFLKALAKLTRGSLVSGRHRKGTGVVTDFQQFGDRVVGAWVRWEGSHVPMPEYPTLLEVEDEPF